MQFNFDTYNKFKLIKQRDNVIKLQTLTDFNAKANEKNLYFYHVYESVKLIGCLRCTT